MSPARRPASLVAERAVRYLSEQPDPVDSVEMARKILATQVSDELTARKVLEAAFGGDPRLTYRNGAWRRVTPERSKTTEDRLASEAREPDRVLILLAGRRQAPGQPLRLTTVAAVRLEEGAVVSACGGDPAPGPGGEQLRRALLEILRGAVPVLHDPPGALPALERWLDEPLESPISLRELGRARLGLKAGHDLETLAGKLGLRFRASEDLLDQAEVLDGCLRGMTREGEGLEDLRAAADRGAPPLDWSRFAFGREFLRSVPRVAGTYRFYDAQERLLYVGKSKNLHRRIGSYFRAGGPRPAGIQALLESLHRIELEPVGSDLEAMLREAALIRRKKPERNVQRRLHARGGRWDRLRSILILEPASSPWVLRAYLLRDGFLVARVAVGPRGAGLRRIERVLEDHFFSVPSGPTAPAGSEVEVEVVSRWLAANRDQVVAFDPTDLGSAKEVMNRLRWFLERGSLLDPDGTPILFR